jgi:hypothetical protein
MTLDPLSAAPAARWLADCIAAGKPALPEEHWLHLSDEGWWISAGHVTAVWKGGADMPTCAVPARMFAAALEAAGETPLEPTLDTKLRLTGKRFAAALPIAAEPSTLLHHVATTPADEDMVAALPGLAALAATDHHRRLTLTADGAWTSSDAAAAAVGVAPTIGEDSMPEGPCVVLPAWAMRALPDAITHLDVAEARLDVVAEGGREMSVRGMAIGGSGYAPNRYPPDLSHIPASVTFFADVLADEVKRVAWAGVGEKVQPQIAVAVADGELRVRIVGDADSESSTPVAAEGEGSFVATAGHLSTVLGAAGPGARLSIHPHPSAVVLTIEGQHLSVMAATTPVRQRSAS